MEITYFLLNIIQLITGLFIVIYEYRKGSLSIFMWATLFIIFNIPHFFIQFGTVKKYDDSVYALATGFVLVFDFLYLITRIWLNSNCNHNVISTLDLKESLTHVDHRIIKYYYGCCIFTTIYMIIYIYSITGSIMGSSWGQIFAIHNNSSIMGFIFDLIPFAIDSAGAVFLYFCSSKKHKIKGILLFLFIFLSVLIRREKQRFLVIAIPVALYVYLRNRKMNFNTVIKYLIYVSLAYSCVLLFAFMRSYSLHDFIYETTFNDIVQYALDSIMTGGDELGLVDAFYSFIMYDNDFPGLSEGGTYIRLLLLWIPTQLSFGVKPTDFAVTMGSAYLREHQSAFSMHPTLYGDAFANFYYFGVILGVFWAFFLTYLDRKVIKAEFYSVRIGLSVLICLNLIMVARGSVYNAIFTIFIGYLLLEIVQLYYKIRLKK